MSHPPIHPPRPSRTLRSLLVAVALVLAAGSSLATEPASAVDDECPNGDPPPCVDPELPPPSWDVEVLQLVEDGASVGTVTGHRTWLTTPVVGGDPTGGGSTGGGTTGGTTTGGTTTGGVTTGTTGGGTTGTIGGGGTTGATAGGGATGTLDGRAGTTAGTAGDTTTARTTGSAPTTVTPSGGRSSGTGTIDLPGGSGGGGTGLPPGTTTTPYGHDVQPAGSATMDGQGRLAFPDTPLPAGATMALRLREAGAPGSLCRTRPLGILPPSRRPLHLLVPAPATLAPSDLTALAQGLVGPVQGQPANITDAGLSPENAGLRLELAADIAFGEGQLKVEYEQLLGLEPVNDTDTTHALAVTRPEPAKMTLYLVAKAPPGEEPPTTEIPEDDPVFVFVAGLMRGEVRRQGQAKVDEALADRPDVRFWTDQGFTLSVRRVTTTSAGLTVEAGLCRFGPR